MLLRLTPTAFFSSFWQNLRHCQATWLLAAVFLTGAHGAAWSAQPKLELHAQSGIGAVVQNPEIRAELVTYAPEGVKKGRELMLGLLLQHQPGWHTYWQNPGDSGLPTELRWSLPTGMAAGPLQWPTPQKIKVGSLSNFGYEGTVLLPVTVLPGADFQPAPGDRDVTIRLSASWLVCQKECIPQEGEFSLRLPLQATTSLHGGLFEAAQAARVQPLRGQVRAEFEGDSLLIHAEGLPSQWQGKSINVFPKTATVFAASASPDEADAVSSDSRVSGTVGAKPKAGTQQWSGLVWSAALPLSPQRTVSPAVVGLLLSLGSVGLEGVAEIKGAWPITSAPPLPGSGINEVAADEKRAVLAGEFSSPSGSDLWWALAAAFVGGLILNLMPCVFPVLAIKVLGFASQRESQRLAPGVAGLAYTAGVVLSMATLGAGLLALRAGGEQLGWGFQLQSPAVIAALALLFTLIALNLVGLLEWGMLVPNSLAGLQLRHPAADAALSGMLAVAVASPCTAPFMGASLGLALTLPAWQAMGIFVALGLGLALPFALASSLPQVAAWLPRPGAWMVHLRHFLAFPMVATVLWLLWVLGHMGGLNAAFSLGALLWAVALTVWSLTLSGRSRWVFGGLAVLVSLALLRTLGPYVLQTQGASLAQSGADLAPSRTALGQWEPWSAQRAGAELASSRPVFVDFTAAWCITCQYNKQTTLSDPAVLRDFADKGVTLLRADWTQRDPSITQALAELGRNGVPVYVLYRAGRSPVVFSEILSAQDLRAALKTL